MPADTFEWGKQAIANLNDQHQLGKRMDPNEGLGEHKEQVESHPEFHLSHVLGQDGHGPGFQPFGCAQPSYGAGRDDRRLVLAAPYAQGGGQARLARADATLQPRRSLRRPLGIDASPGGRLHGVGASSCRLSSSPSTYARSSCIVRARGVLAQLWLWRAQSSPRDKLLLRVALD